MLLFILFNSPAVQTYITQKIAKYMSNRLKTEFSVGSVNIGFFNNIELRDVLIRDLKKDTLAFVGKASVSISDFSLSGQIVFIRKIEIQDPVVNLYLDSLNKMNYSFLAEAFGGKDSSESSPWRIFIKKLAVDNCRFTYRKYNSVAKDLGINYSDIGLSGLNLEIDRARFFEDSVLFTINNLRFNEKSGFELKYLGSDVTIDTNGVMFKRLVIKTPSSRINAARFAFLMKSTRALDDFTNKVKMNAELKPSLIGAADLSFFTESIYGLKEKITLSGLIKGTISDLRVKNIKIRYLDNTFISGNINITGLPDTEETFTIMELSELTTHPDDLRRIPLPPFNTKNYPVLPDFVTKLGKIKYKGQLTGFLNDFVAYGSLTTDAGFIDTDIKIRQGENSGETKYKGHLVTKNFNLGKIFNASETIGMISINAQVDAKTIGNSFEAKIDGMINNIELQKYLFSNIKIEGDISEKTFNGSFNIKDPNLNLAFLGKIDFSEKVPVFDFTADVAGAKLYKLNLNKTDSLSDISFLLSARLSGSNINDIAGKIELFSLKYISSKTKADFSYTSLTSAKNQEGITETRILSDVLDATLTGRITYDKLPVSFVKMLNTYIPSVNTSFNNTQALPDAENDDYWKMNVTFKKTGPLLREFIPGLNIAEGTTAELEFNQKEKFMKFELNANDITYDNTIIEKPHLTFRAENENLRYTLTSEKIALSPTLNVRNININGNVTKDNGATDISWFNPDSTLYKGNLSFLFTLYKRENKLLPSVLIEANPSQLVFSGVEWYINDAAAEITDTAVSIRNMTINHESQYLFANGRISRKLSDTLHVILNQIDLANTDLLTKGSGVEVDGIISGNAQISGLFGKATILTQLEIENFKLNNEDLGNAYISSSWDNVANNIYIEGNTKRGIIKTVDFKGAYFTDGKLDFDVTLDRLRLSVFEPYVKSAICDLRGIISGNLKINGKAEHPQIEGLLKIQKAAFMVSYLQSRYNFTSDITVKPGSFEFKNLDLYDSEGNKATVNGVLTHNNFSDIKFNTIISTDKFLFLNTREKDNELFYGKAFASGVIEFSGTPENINIDINAKTEKNTKFYIPLSSGTQVTEQNYIRFKNQGKQITPTTEETTTDLSGIQLSLNLQATPEAEVQIIFDSKVGDVIRGTGTGNIRMEITSSGDFKMFGGFVIESGDYLFTLQNVINKKFDVQKGGTISWNGNPYEANLDITAIYKLKASLYDLMLDSAYKQRVPVECVLNMKNNLTQPDFQFAIKLTESDSKPKSVISSMSNEEINKQIISLLVLNRFVTPESFKGGAQVAENRGGNAVGMNSSELLSNQLSHWLSQISKDFNIGVNYRPGDELTHDEVELALSTQILNDRIILNGNVGMGGNQANQASNFVGDFEINAKINKSGKLMLKGFNRSNNNNINETSPYTQGLGLLYREDFNSVDELMRRYWQGMFRKSSNK